jgi:hypothetical protein
MLACNDNSAAPPGARILPIVGWVGPDGAVRLLWPEREEHPAADQHPNDPREA